jgi:U3 small nucleolar RNA-associated protein 14
VFVNYFQTIAMEAFGVDERIDKQLAELMQDLSREFLGEECSVSSQISESEFENARESDDDEEEESDYEDNEEIDSQSIARNYVKNCAADSNEECCDVGSRAEIEGIFRDEVVRRDALES